MSFSERLEALILSYEHGGRRPEAVQVELLRLMTEILVDVHDRLPRRPTAGQAVS